MRDAAREWARQEGIPRDERLDALDRFETFHRNVGGLAEPSAPLGVRRADGAGAAPSVAMPFGRFVRTAPPAQTWDDGRLDFGEPTEDAGWSDHSPATGTTKRLNVPEEDAYWDLAAAIPVDLPGAEVRTCDLALKADGETVKSWPGVRVNGNGLFLHRQLGVKELNSALTLEHVGGDPLPVASGGEVSMQLVDRQVGTVQEEAAPEVEAVAWGIVGVGSDFWLSEGDNGRTLTRYDSGWNEVESFTITDSAIVGSVQRLRGVTWDGSSLWVTGGGNDVGQVNPATGAVESKFQVASDSNTRNEGITWDGTHLWVYDRNQNRMIRFTTGGAQQSSFDPGSPGTFGAAGGLAYHDGLLYLMKEDGLRVFDTDGVQQGLIDVSEIVADPTGVWIASDGTLYVSKPGADGGVWRRPEPIT